LPAMAYVLGLGRPGLIIPVYALLNLFFWFGLLALMVIYLKARSARDYACVAAAALTTGVLISVERSLTDLPATTLGLWAAMLDGAAASVVLSLSMLTKPTFGLLLTRHLWPVPSGLGEVRRRGALIALALIPPGLLIVYILTILGNLPSSSGNLGLPVIDWFNQCWSNGQALWSTPFHFTTKEVSDWEWKFFEFVAPICMMVQVTHFAIWRQPTCPVWWLGASFALLFLCLTHSTLVEHIATARTTLPLTVVFNLRLAAQRGWLFLFYFIAGNLGLLWAVHDMVVQIR
jgi:hypothetical protein